MPWDTHRGLGSASVPRARLPVQGTVRRCCSVLSTSCLLERANGDELTRGRDLGRGHQQASRTFQVQRGCPVYVDEESACWSLGAPHAGSCPRPPPASPIAGIKPFLCARPRGRGCLRVSPPRGARVRSPERRALHPRLGAAVGLEEMAFGFLPARRPEGSAPRVSSASLCPPQGSAQQVEKDHARGLDHRRLQILRGPVPGQPPVCLRPPSMRSQVSVMVCGHGQRPFGFEK